MDPDPLPRRIGPYLVLRELGQGRQGRVVLAELAEPRFRLPRGTAVALKLLHPELCADAAALERFEREAELGTRVSSPNVIRILGLEHGDIEGQQRYWLVLEHLRGQTLREFLVARGPAVEGLARRVGREAALGLAALHRAGIVHRDVKPENLFLTDEGTTRLMDLGFALKPRGERSSGVPGSIAYAAPEVLRGRPATPASDLWSLGVVLYELATGTHPFATHQGHADELLTAILHEQPAPPSTLRPRLGPFFDRVVLALLDKAAEGRFASAAALARCLEQGEDSRFWREVEALTPVLASEARLRRSLRPSKVPLVGRARELALLDACLTEARAGQLRVLHLRGVEGVGKRRLVDEWVRARLAEPDPPLYFAGEPAPRSEARLLSPFDDFLVEHHSRYDPGGEDPDAGPDAAAERRALPPDRRAERLALRLTAEHGLREGQAERMARWLLGLQHPEDEKPIRGLAEVLASLGGAARPVVVRLHRPERMLEGALELLRALVRLPGPVPVLLVLTSHREDPRPELDGIPVVEHAVEQLDPEASERLFEALFADAGEAVRARRELLAQIAPVPGLVIESLEWMRGRGLLDGEPGSYARFTSGVQLPLKGRLRHMLEAAWDLLDREEQRLLTAAAVLGPRFRARDLAALSDLSELEVLRRLTALRTRWILSFGEDLRFRRRSQRHLALARAPDDERAALHARAAVVLAARGEGPIRVGMQWSRAGVHDKAIPLLLEAARELLANRAIERVSVVVRRLDLHLDHLPRLPSTMVWRLEALGLRARLELLRERPGPAVEHLRRGLSMARILDREDDERRLRGVLAEAENRRGRVREALAQARAALDRLPAGHDQERAVLLWIQGTSEHRAGHDREALATLRQAQDTCEQGPPSRLRARIHVAVGGIQTLRLRLQLGEHDLGRAEAMLRELGEEKELDRLALLRMHLALHLGEPLEPWIAELGRADFGRGDAARFAELRGVAAFAAGRPADALDHLRAARALAERTGDAVRLLSIRLRDHEAECELGLGGTPRALRHLDEARQLGLPRLHCRATRLLARLEREDGAAGEALARCEAELVALRRLSIEPTVRLGLDLERSRALAALGRDGEAARVRRFARRWLARLVRRMPGRTARRRFVTATPIRRALYTWAP
ncbi:MAG: protein kinase [Planctomycetota bacterium]